MTLGYVLKASYRLESLEGARGCHKNGEGLVGDPQLDEVEKIKRENYPEFGLDLGERPGLTAGEEPRQHPALAGELMEGGPLTLPNVN